MADASRLPMGARLWEERDPLVRSASVCRLDEVKIIGKKGDKVAVWKQAPGKEARVVWIQAKNVSNPEHEPYLIDPPPGTEDEAPAIGDLGDPKTFSGDISAIKPLHPEKPVPETGWLPSHKLKMLAQKLKDLGIQPQNTFSKAVAAGEPVPDAVPEPVGLSGLPAAGVEPDEPKELPDNVKELLKNKEWDEVAASSAKLNPGQQLNLMGDLIDALDDVKESENWDEAAKMASLIAAVAKHAGKSKISDSYAQQAGEFEKKATTTKEPEKKAPTNSDVKHAVDDRNYAFLIDNATDLTLDQLDYVSASYPEAVTEKDFEKMAALATVMAKAWGEKPEGEAWAKLAKQAAQKAAEEPKEPELPTPPDAPKTTYISPQKVAAALKSGAHDFLHANAAKIGKKGQELIAARVQEAEAAGDWDTALALSDVLQVGASTKKQQAEWAAKKDEYWKKTAEKQVAAGEPPPEPPTKAGPPDNVPDETFDWMPKASPNYKPVTPSEAFALQQGLGLGPGEFIHAVMEEVFRVVDLADNEYVDPKTGIILDKNTGQVVKKAKKQIAAAGLGLKAPTSDPTAAPVLTDVPAKPPPEAQQPESPPPAAITPSKLKPGDLPKAPPAQETAAPAAMAKAAAKVKPPAEIPEPSTLTLVGSANGLGGYGDKQLYEDAKGQKWLFKLAFEKSGTSAKPYAAVVQQVWSQVARLMRPEQLAIGVVKIGGKIGTLQPFLDRDEQQPDLRHTHPKDLSDDDRTIVAREHLLDWMMSQHDSHGAQFIRAKDGTIYGIDKEQGFRFFGSDRLAIDYRPNPETPYYNTFWTSWVKGEFDFDPMVMKEALEKLESIPTADYIAMLRPYVETLYPNKPAEQAKFLKAAKKRKLDLRKDFERFITDLYRKKEKTDKGEFTFDKGWASEKAGPKKVVKKLAFKAPSDPKQGTEVLTPDGSTSQPGWVINIPGFEGLRLKPALNPMTGEPDPTKYAIKVSNSDAGGITKMKHLLDKAGIPIIPPPPEVVGAAGGHIKGSQYTIILVSKADWDAAHMEVEEIIEPAGIAKTPPKARYFPDEYDNESVTSNAQEIDQLHATKLGRHGRRFSADGPAVEGSVLRAKKFREPGGQPYHLVHFKLRKHVWLKLATQGTIGKFSFPLASYDEGEDAFEEVGGHSDTVATRMWKVEGSEVHLATGTEKWSYMGSCYIKVRPKKGQTPAQAVRAALAAVSPDLESDVFRNPTAEEQEIHRLSRILWAKAPQVADQLPESQRTVQNLRNLLKQHKIKDEEIEATTHEEVFPGYSAHVERGRSKRLAGGKFRYLFNGINSVSSAISILQTGLMGIHERNLNGIPQFGVSYSSDVNSGSGDGILVSTVTESGFGFNFQNHPFAQQLQVLIHPDEADRLDTYMYRGDHFGRCRESDTDWQQRASVEKEMQNQQKSYATAAEMSFRRGIRKERLLRLVCPTEAVRLQAIKEAKGAGILEVNGVPIEDFIVHETNLGQAYEKYVRPLMET